MSNGIDFVIGGKDKASPAMSAVENSMKRIESATVKLKTGTKDLMATLAPLLAIYAAAKAAFAFVGGVKSANEAFDSQTESLRKLNSALQIRGAESMSASMQSVAKQMEKVTGVSDNVTMGLMQQATGMGFAADRMDDAAKAAQGLSQATGKDATASLTDLKAALEGNFEAFYQINPAIMYMTSNQQRMAAVMAIANQGLKQQSEDMNTVAGSGRRADSAMASLMKSAGAVLAPFRVLINAGIQQFATSIQEVLAPAVEYAKELMANIGPVMDWVKEKVVQGVNIIIGAWTMFEVVITNLPAIWEAVTAAVELAMIKIYESVRYALVEVIPAYAKWFGENFVNLMRDGMNLAYTVISNRITNIIDSFKALWEFIASGGTSDVLGQLGEIAGRSYFEGFQSSLTGLPELAGRQITQREKDLADKIGQVGANLGKQFTDKMKERMIGVGETLKSELESANNIDLRGRNAVVMQGINATEGRLLTRGTASTSLTVPQLLQQIDGKIGRLLEKPGVNNDDERTVNAIKEKAQNELRLVPTR